MDVFSILALLYCLNTCYFGIHIFLVHMFYTLIFVDFVNLFEHVLFWGSYLLRACAFYFGICGLSSAQLSLFDIGDLELKLLLS